MEIKYTKSFGNDKAEFVIDEKDSKKALEMMVFLSTPDYCWLDGFQDAKVFWEVRRAKGKDGTPTAGQTFVYIERKVRSKDGKWATSQMGEYQGGGYFWKRWEVYDPSGQTPKQGDDNDF